ncbi:unnamed protein product, partial [Iphiclides podalirius]
MQNGVRRGPFSRALPSQSVSPLIKLGLLFSTSLCGINDRIAGDTFAKLIVAEAEKLDVYIEVPNEGQVEWPAIEGVVERVVIETA